MEKWTLKWWWIICKRGRFLCNLVSCLDNHFAQLFTKAKSVENNFKHRIMTRLDIFYHFLNRHAFVQDNQNTDLFNVINNTGYSPMSGPFLTQGANFWMSQSIYWQYKVAEDSFLNTMLGKPLMEFGSSNIFNLLKYRSLNNSLLFQRKQQQQ